MTELGASRAFKLLRSLMPFMLGATLVMGLGASEAAADEQYSEFFTGGTTYSSGSTQFDNWTAFRAVLPSSDVQTITISGTNDATGRTCSVPASAQQIADNLRTSGGTLQTVVCGGFNWNTGTCGGGIELNVDASLSGICSGSHTYAIRPHIGNANWGGINGTTVGASSQTMAIDVTETAPATGIYSENFVGGTGYSTGSPQWDNWTTFSAGPPSSGIQSVTISGSNDATGRTCSTPALAQQIMDNLRTNGGTSQTVSCDGNNWNTGPCGGGTELNVGSAAGVCACSSTNYSLRPHIGSGNANWGGVTGSNCSAATQTMTASYSSTSVTDPLEVTSTADTNTLGTLRYAINYANANAGDDDITFNISGSGPHTIFPTSALPIITDDDVTIDGSTQSGAVCGQLTTGTQHTIEVAISGVSAGAVSLLDVDAEGVTIKGLSIIDANRYGVNVSTDGDDFTLECAYVGVDPDGTTASPNAKSNSYYYGVSIFAASNATIRNSLISGNDDDSTDSAVYFAAAGGTIEGNIVGLNASGTAALGNGHNGLTLQGTASNVTLGGSTAATRNVISGNATSGIAVNTSGSGNQIFGNIIGLSRDGSATLGNGDDGIRILGTSEVAVYANAIYGNGGIGIDLTGADGVDANDSSDGDSGSNDMLNFPVINSFGVDGTTAVTYDINLDTPANGNGYRIDFFKNTAADGTGNGEGEVHLGSVDVAGPGTNTNFTGSFTANTSVSTGNIISATTTRKTGGSTYDITSEFASNTAASGVDPLVVTNTNDSGSGSLRAAIDHANANSGDDDITFNISGGGVHIISPTSELPQITDDGVSIDGSTQTGAVCGQLTTGTQHTLNIQLDGTSAGLGSEGLKTNATDVSFKGMSITNFDGHGLLVNSGADNFVLECSYIGVAPDGVTKGPNSTASNSGPAIRVNSNTNPIIWNNLISGNDDDGVDDGMRIQAVTGGLIEGNIIGLNAAGTAALGNADFGIDLDSGTTGTIIGGTTAATRNVISANGDAGIIVDLATGVQIYGNYIGLARDGTTIIGNGSDGIRVNSSSTAAIYGNRIAGNTNEGIDLDNDGVTTNDSGDGDSGPNDLLNFPVFNSFGANGATSVVYDIDLDVPSNGNGYRIDFYQNSVLETYGEGEVHLGSVDVAHAGGDLNFTGSFTANSSVSSGDYISATTTRKTGGSTYDITSEFAETETAVSAADPLIVTSTDDTNTLGTLRYAINHANANAGDDEISFDIGGGGVHVISLLSALPTISDDNVFIEGSTQSGASCGQLTTGTQHTLNIRIDGVGAGAGDNIFTINADGVTLKGMSLTGAAGYAVNTSFNADDLILECLYIGVAPDGATKAPNATAFGLQQGVRISGAENVTVRNSLISGNDDDNTDDGIRLINVTGGVIEGSIVGLNAEGSAALGNGDMGILVDGTSSGITIGGTTAATRNVIGANDDIGLWINGVSGVDILGNYIGVGANGSTDLGNESHGIALVGSDNINIGDGTAAGRNVIGGSSAVDRAGIDIDDGSSNIYIDDNYIGTNAIGDAAVPNYYGIAANGDVTGDLHIHNNLVSGNAGYVGVALFYGETINAEITGNIIGLNAAGTAAIPNAYGIGISSITTQTDTLIQDNIISGNTAYGLSFQSGTNGAIVLGNIIGLNAAGDAKIPNGTHGIHISSGGNDVSIGDGTAGGRNVITGNDEHGISVSGTVANLDINGNYIGALASGLSAIGNGPHTNFVDGGTGLIVYNATLTGTFDVSNNLISGNDSIGVYVRESTASTMTFADNLIGVDKNGSNDLGNKQGINFSSVVGNVISGLTISGNTISGSEAHGIQLSTGVNGAVVTGNMIGTNSAGDTAVSNGSHGTNITDATNITIGGTLLADRNVISGNGADGIRAGSNSSSITILGNYIGINAAGGTDIANTNDGIQIDQATDVTIGDGTAAGRNVISGNGTMGMQFLLASTATVSGNYIGTAADGVSDLGNDEQGIYANGDSVVQITGNIIAFTKSNDGIEVAGAATKVAIYGNSIHSNSEQGIEIDTDHAQEGVNANDSGDGDSGTNDNLNFPVINSFTADGSTSVMYNVNLDVPADANGYRIEFFKNSTADPIGHGEGETYLGFVDTGNHAGGDQTFTGSFTAATTVSVGNIISATATRKTGGSTYDITSEFAANSLAVAPPSPLVVTSTADTNTLGTLRYAINHANANSGDDDITFNISGGGAQVITLASALPNITDNGVSIDGTSQPGATCGNLWGGTPHTLKINIDGNGAAFIPLYVEGESVSLKGLSVTGIDPSSMAAVAVYFHAGADNGSLTCSYIGLAPDGTAGAVSYGVATSGGNTVIGGAGAGDGNVISSAQLGGIVPYGTASGLHIEGNFIGTDPLGTSARPNLVGGIHTQAPTPPSTGMTWSVVRKNLISGNAGHGIFLDSNHPISGSSGDVLIAGNYIGVDRTGNTDLANGSDGIHFESNSISGVTIGGTVAADRNIVSGNGDDGVYLDGVDGIDILGNYIGLGADGVTNVGNTALGISLNNATDINVGDGTGSARNVISGNGDKGLEADGTSTLTIAGNYIGTTFTGLASVPNVDEGVSVRGSSTATISNNVISGNGLSFSAPWPNGIAFITNATGTVTGNKIGVGADGTTALPNTGDGLYLDTTGQVYVGDGTSTGSNIIANNEWAGVHVLAATKAAIIRNSIFGNDGLGIDLNNDLVTANDSGDGDSGPNDLLNFPVINSFAPDGSGDMAFDINLDVPSHGFYRIEFYKNSTADASGHGEGETFLGFFDVFHLGGDTNFTGSFTPSEAVLQGNYIAATATRKTGSTYDITSEFSLTIMTGSATELTGSKSVSVWDPSSAGLYNLPGNDVISSLTITNPGAASADTDSIVIIEGIASELTFYNGDIDDGGAETNPVSFAQTGGAGLTFTYATDVRYSNAGTKPANFAACGYTPTAGYDTNVIYVCFNPKGAMAAGDPDPTFTLEYRARIK